MCSVLQEPLISGAGVVILSRVVPADVDSGVQLSSGGAVYDQSPSLQGLYRSTGVQIHLHDVTHWSVYKVYT